MKQNYWVQTSLMILSRASIHHFLQKKANSRVLLLRKACEYTNSTDDLRSIYLMHVRNALEQSCVIWHSNLTEENKTDLERIQKNACRIILGNQYVNYEESLKRLNLPTLSERREKLALRFALNCTENEKTKKLFPLKRRKFRNEEKYKVIFAKTKRLANSTVPYLQKLLNKFEKRQNDKKSNKQI